MSEKCQKISIGAHRIVSRVKITLANLGYPNGRYQEVPLKKPPHHKILLSFFTQGVLRVPDLYKKKSMKIWQHKETQGASRDAPCQCLPPPQRARGRGVTTTTSASWWGWGKGERHMSMFIYAYPTTTRAWSLSYCLTRI